MNVRDSHLAHVADLLSRPAELTATDTTWTTWSLRHATTGTQRATFATPADLNPDDMPAHLIEDGGDLLP